MPLAIGLCGGLTLVVLVVAGFASTHPHPTSRA
jgi:hypothetical protein